MVLEKAEETEIKLPTSAGSWEKQESSQKTSLSALLTMPKPWLWLTTNCGKFFKRLEYQTTWPVFWEICMQVRKQQNWTISKSGREYVKAVYCHPAYLTYKQSTSCEMLGWMKYKLESRLPGEITITSDMQMTPPLWQKAKRKEESEKLGLKLSIQKTKIMASGPTTSLHIVGETMKTVTDFIFLGSKITADGDFSHEIQGHLLLGRKLWQT